MNLEKVFQSDHYMRHTQRRQEHLTTLGLPLHEKIVLEIGAGIGDHTSFFRDRGCGVVATDAKPDNVAYMVKRFKDDSNVQVQIFDVNITHHLFQTNPFDIIYCYGLLYHLEFPEMCIHRLSRYCKELFLLETQVSHTGGCDIQTTHDSKTDPSGSLDNVGCLPSREWVLTTLNRYFQYAYMVNTQPWHEEFPIDWTKPHDNLISRAVFVASRRKMDHSCLSLNVLDHQERC